MMDGEVAFWTVLGTCIAVGVVATTIWGVFVLALDALNAVGAC